MSHLTYAAFMAAAPTIATSIREKLATTGVALLGTIRKDGSPRISPIETMFHGDGMYLGMMPQSVKALDLRRDGRFTLLTPVADKEDIAGEGKLFGTAVEVTDPETMTTIFGAAFESSEFTLEDIAGSHLFELRIASAAWQHVDVQAETWNTTSWSVDGGLRQRRRVGGNGLSEDVPLG